MPEETSRTVKKQLTQANRLISEKRYDEARELLSQIDHPQAKLWLKQLANKQQHASRRAFSPILVLAGVAGAVVIAGVIAALMVLPSFTMVLRPNTLPDPYEDDFTVSDEEIRYANITSYCYEITGYGGSDLCLDWADLLLSTHRATVLPCVEPLMDKVTLEDADYVTFGNCLNQDPSIPPPF